MAMVTGRAMKKNLLAVILLTLSPLGSSWVRVSSGKEFLTPKEIEKIQDAQEIEDRVKVYMEAARLRLETAQERLEGKESEPGDPLEFYTPDEMVDGYYRIIRSVMFNIDEAYQKHNADQDRFVKALKNLKGTTEWAGRVLASLKKTAEEKRNEALWNAVNQAIDITSGAHEGAELGLSKKSSPPSRKK